MGRSRVVKPKYLCSRKHISRVSKRQLRRRKTSKKAIEQLEEVDSCQYVDNVQQSREVYEETDQTLSQSTNSNVNCQDPSDEIDVHYNDSSDDNESTCSSFDSEISSDDFSMKTLQYDDSCEESSSDEELLTECKNLQDRLRICFARSDLNQVQMNNILRTVRSHDCLSFLTKCYRTIMKTPRKPATFKKVDPGEYYHIGLVNALTTCLCECEDLETLTFIFIDLSTDGVATDKQNKFQIWPIQCRIVNLQESKPEIIGFYRGRGKPNNANELFADVLTEAKDLKENGLLFDNHDFQVKFRLFVGDAPARALVLNHKGHNAKRPCSKCHVMGEKPYKSNMYFKCFENNLRTHDEYLKRDLQDEHFKKGDTPLEDILDNLVDNVVFEYMHLILLGIMKRWLTAIVSGEFGKRVKLPTKLMNVIMTRMTIVESFCPREFSRKPTSLYVFSTYKATEFRLLLLYTLIVVFLGVLEFEVYMNILLLHAAIRCLTKNSFDDNDLELARKAIIEFLHTSRTIFGKKFLSYDLHAVTHLVDDAERFGKLDDWSAFPYENNVSFFRKYVKKPGKELQQISNRLEEKKHLPNQKKVPTGQKLMHSHRNGPLIPKIGPCLQYRQIHKKDLFLSIEKSDNCCILKNGDICLIENVLLKDERVLVLVRIFGRSETFYDVGITSQANGIFKCSELSEALFLFPLEDIEAKCYRMPFWEARYKENDGILNLCVPQSDYCDDDDHDDVVEELLRRTPVPDMYIVLKLF